MHTQVYLVSHWLGGPISLSTPHSVPAQCAEGCWHIARGGRELPYQCSIDTPGLHPQGLLCSATSPSASNSSTSYAHTQVLNANATMQSCKLAGCHLATGTQHRAVTTALVCLQPQGTQARHQVTCIHSTVAITCT